MSSTARNHQKQVNAPTSLAGQLLAAAGVDNPTAADIAGAKAIILKALYHVHASEEFSNFTGSFKDVAELIRAAYATDWRSDAPSILRGLGYDEDLIRRDADLIQRIVDQATARILDNGGADAAK
jgi:hypothetical protein